MSRQPCRYKTYDKIDDAEELLVSAKTKKRSLLADKITGDNIYKALIFFDKLYAQMNEAEKREFLSQLVDNVQIYEERKENGQWLKSIEFKLPIIGKEFALILSILVDTFISKISFPMQPGPEIGSISDA